jgi:threonine/homoserine/homoserine lactone efflux protein
MTMGEVLPQLIPLAAVVAVNPLPVIAMILVLQTSQGRRAGSAFVAAWVVALVLLGGVALVIANHTDLYGSGSASLAARLIRGAVGVMLVFLAVRKWLGRPRSGEDAKSPAWMKAIASTTPAKSARLGALLAAGNPKNIAVTLAAAAAIVEGGFALPEEFGALAFYVVLATLGVGVPLVVVLLLGSRADDVLAGWGRWLNRYNAVLMTGVLLVIGLLLIVGAITG